MTNLQDEFADIRHSLTNDDEVKIVFARLLDDPGFLDLMANFSCDELSTEDRSLRERRVLTASRWSQITAQVHGVADVKQMILSTFKEVVKHTTWPNEGITCSGLEKLDPHRAYLFVSNHRNILMDPMLINLELHRAKLKTALPVSGDNLQREQFVSDMLLLNGCIKMRRFLSGREHALATDRLMRYIHHCVVNGTSVWISQSEGRSKNGVDKTSPALVKRLARAWSCELALVPVSVSYQFEPTALLLAEETIAGKTSRSVGRDVAHFVEGIKGFKGSVHIAFGPELRFENRNVEEMTLAIDRQIIGGYRLHETNYRALEILLQYKPCREKVLNQAVCDRPYGTSSDQWARDKFEQELKQVPWELGLWGLWSELLRLYANPVINRCRYEATDPTEATALASYLTQKL